MRRDGLGSQGENSANPPGLAMPFARYPNSAFAPPSSHLNSPYASPSPHPNSAYPSPSPLNVLRSSNLLRRELFPDFDARSLQKGSILDDDALKRLKHRYWAKSITGSLLWKMVKTILFFIGTAGLNAFTLEQILGHHQDTQLPQPCINIISEGAGMSLGGLVLTMALLAVCTCFTNAIARAKALGSDNDGFDVVHSLTPEQKRHLHGIDDAFKTLILFPDGKNIFYISEEDKQSFGGHFQTIMNFMTAKYMYDEHNDKYGKFVITSSIRDLNYIKSSAYRNDDCADGPEKFNVIVFNGKLSTRGLLTPTCRIIPIDISNQIFQWRNFRQEIKRVFLDVGLRGNLYRLWSAFLWVLIKGFPGLFVILQINKALHSLEEVFGLNQESHWAIQLTCLTFNMFVALNRTFINNEMKGNEVYRLMRKRTVRKKYQLPSEKINWSPFFKAAIISSIPIVVTILYLTFTSLFFASEGPISFGKQITGILPKSWMKSLTPKGSYINFLLNVITYGSTITGLIIGIPTQCRAFYRELYKYFNFKKNQAASASPSLSEAELGSGGASLDTAVAKSRFACCSIGPGLAIFYLSTLFDSGQFGLNAWYNSMQAMLDPKHLFITNALGACKFALGLSAIVGIGITLTSMAWSKYTGDKKYNSCARLFKRDPRQKGIALDNLTGATEDDYLLATVPPGGGRTLSRSASSLNLKWSSRTPSPQTRRPYTPSPGMIFSS